MEKIVSFTNLFYIVVKHGINLEIYFVRKYKEI